MQEHPAHCQCYYCYLESKQWIREKRKAWLRDSTTYCSICKQRKTLEYHHFKGYSAIWTKNDYLYIVKVCRNCHQKCHFKGKQKIPLLKKDLLKRYLFLKRVQPILGFRPSMFFNWLYQTYKV